MRYGNPVVVTSSSKQSNGPVHSHYSLPKNVPIIPTAQLEWKSQNKKPNFSGRFTTDTGQVCEWEEKCLYLKTLTQCKTQIETGESKVSLLALLSFPAWETHLQGVPHSRLVLIHQRQRQLSAFPSLLFHWHKWQRFVCICKDACGYQCDTRYNITVVLVHAAEFHDVTWKNMLKTCLLRLN